MKKVQIGRRVGDRASAMRFWEVALFGDQQGRIRSIPICRRLLKKSLIITRLRGLNTLLNIISGSRKSEAPGKSDQIAAQISLANILTTYLHR